MVLVGIVGVGTGAAQIFPEDKSIIYHTHVLFQSESVINADNYQLEIWDKTTNQIFPTLKTGYPLHSTLLKDFIWEHKYSWKSVAYSKGKVVFTSPLRTFTIASHSKVNPELYRHKIIKNSLQIADSFFIFIDNPGIAIDLKGNPIWFYPDTNVSRVFNLQIRPNGNIAALKPNGVKAGNENLTFEEIDFSTGRVIRTAPLKFGDTAMSYHHEFQLLSNGNLLLAGADFSPTLPVGSKDPIHVKHGTIVEINPQGERVWYWNSKDYLKPEDLFADGLNDNPSHLNSFYYDEKNDKLWVSFRYLDRVIEMDKGSKTVLRSFGRKMPSGEAKLANDWFHRQHSPKLIHNGKHLMMYDNGTGKGNDTASSLLIFQLPDDKESGKITYRFPMKFAGRRQSWSESKGDADCISNKLYLVDMGALPRTVIVDTTEGIVWQAEHESRRNSKEEWRNVEENYRADFTYTLFPQRWSVTIGKGEKRKKAANYPLVLYNFGLKGAYTVRFHSGKGNLIQSEKYSFTQERNYQFATINFPRKNRKGNLLGYITIHDPITDQEVYSLNIVKK